MAQTGSFVQIINVTTDRFDEMDKLQSAFREEMAGTTSVERVTITKSLDTPNLYTMVAEFPNQKVAMENSNNPKTQNFAEQMQKLATAPPTYQNLEVIRVETF